MCTPNKAKKKLLTMEKTWKQPIHRTHTTKTKERRERNCLCSCLKKNMSIIPGFLEKDLQNIF